MDPVVPKPPFTPELVLNGYPVPWSLVHAGPDGAPTADFKHVNMARVREGLERGLCGVCGRPLPKRRPIAWLGGRASTAFLDLPNHLRCAAYAARECPFLSQGRTRTDMGDSGDYAVHVGIGYVVHVVPRPDGDVPINVPRRLLDIIALDEFSPQETAGPGLPPLRRRGRRGPGSASLP